MSREAFEAAMRERYGDSLLMARSTWKPESYAEEIIEWAWLGWKLREMQLSEQRTESESLREALKNLLATVNGEGGTKHDAFEIARAALEN